jgi:AraC-like DNA-binding protein
MSGGGTQTFTDPSDYQASIARARINLVFTGCGDFKARLTHVDLPNLQLLRGQENLPRIAYVSLARDAVFVAFPMRSPALAIWGGVELQSGAIVFHSRGERMHQRTSGPSQWASISMAPEHLAVYGQVLTEQNLVPPPLGQVLRPPAVAAARLRRVHTQACRLAETKPHLIARPEVARALEHDLLHALVNCLTAGDVLDQAGARRRHANIVVRFEEVLAAHSGRQLRMPELCTAIGVPERTLQVCCAEVLGMSPSRYVLLRRLNLVRAGLRHADPATATVAEHARRYGFSELGRFATLYRAAFGETPSTTLRRAADFSNASAQFA